MNLLCVTYYTSSQIFEKYQIFNFTFLRTKTSRPIDSTSTAVPRVSIEELNFRFSISFFSKHQKSLLKKQFLVWLYWNTKSYKIWECLEAILRILRLIYGRRDVEHHPPPPKIGLRVIQVGLFVHFCISGWTISQATKF